MTTAGARPALLALLHASSGDADQRISRALHVLAEATEMDVAFVSVFTDGRRVITHASTPDGQRSPLTGLSHPVEDTICHLMAHGLSAAVHDDLATDPQLVTHPHTLAFGLGAYAGVPLRLAGELVGAVCCASTGPQPTLKTLADSTLATISDYIGEVLAEAAHVPGQRPPEPGLRRLADVVATGQSLESLTRPLLEILQQVTGLESTYLTTVDWAAGTQRVAFSTNTATMVIPEGAEAPWADTLCRRSLESGVQITSDVPSVWGDVQAARDLGIRTYVSVAVRDEHDEVVGTLCGASSESTLVNPADLAAMDMFARLLGAELARESAREHENLRSAQLEKRTRELTELATRDPLTGASNRAGVHAWLETVLLELRPESEQLAVAFLDVDDFKAVNDSYGHAVGDAALCALVTSLTALGRPGDLIGRLGGDEFVIAAVLPARAATFGGWVARVQRAARISVAQCSVTASVGAYAAVDSSLSSDDVLAKADAAMYVTKRARAGR